MPYLDKISKLCDDKPITITRTRVESYMSKTHEEGLWILSTPGDVIAMFSLVCMPGCCGVVISTNCQVSLQYRRRGLGTLLNEMRRQMAYELGYSCMLCTDVIDNIPQQRILRAWNCIANFTNRRTGNHILLHEIQLMHIDNLGFNL